MVTDRVCKMATHPPSCGLVSLTLYTIPCANAPGALAHFLRRGSLICPGGSLASYLQGQESTELTAPGVRKWGPAEGMAAGWGKIRAVPASSESGVRRFA